MSRTADASYRRQALLPQTAVAAAVTDVLTDAYEVGVGVVSVLLEAVFTYGSGGTNATAWVQTRTASGQWIDIACFQFTTSSGRKLANLGTRAAVATIYDAAALTANATKDGILGDALRVKLTTTGTYGGTTHIAVHVLARGR